MDKNLARNKKEQRIWKMDKRGRWKKKERQWSDTLNFISLQLNYQTWKQSLPCFLESSWANILIILKVHMRIKNDKRKKAQSLEEINFLTNGLTSNSNNTSKINSITRAGNVWYKASIRSLVLGKPTFVRTLGRRAHDVTIVLKQVTIINYCTIIHVKICSHIFL